MPFLNEDRHTHNIAVLMNGKEGIHTIRFLIMGRIAGEYNDGLSAD